MLRYIVFLAAAVTLQLSLSQTLSAQPHEGQVLLSASGGDDLGAADWTDEGAYGIHPMDADDRADAALDEMYADAEDDALYPFANAEHGWPFVEPLAGALGGDRQVLDPRFNNGKLYLDRFGGTASDKGNYLGQKVLRLSNGHVLTVALVPPLGAGAGTLIPAPSNIGMIRHNDKGVRQTWPHAAGAFTSLERYHFVFPNQRDSADGNFSEIHDVAEHNDWIYVLATRRVSSTDTDVRVVRFSMNSSRWRWNQVGSWAGTREEGVGFSFHHSRQGHQAQPANAGDDRPRACRPHIWRRHGISHPRRSLAAREGSGLRIAPRLRAWPTRKKPAVAGLFLFLQ